MNNEGIKTFKTKVYTLISILSVLIFLIYIMGLVLIQSGPLKLAKAPDVEVVKMIRGEEPGAWKVVLSFSSGGDKVLASLDIHRGKIVSKAEDETALGIKEIKTVGVPLVHSQD
jgi:hypothetical protein